MGKMDEFKSVALEMGYDPKEVEAFSGVIGGMDSTMSSAPSMDTSLSFGDMSKGLGYEPEQVDAFSGMAKSAGESMGRYVDMGEHKFGGSAIGAPATLTQAFGNRNSRYNRISGGVNRGADFGISEGTPLFAPEGANWEVVDAYSGARGRGMQNSGYGNSALLRNTNTGETVRMSHLSQVGVKAGDIIKGGSPIGLSGSTGHATGPHVDVEYMNTQGKLSNVLRSPYAHQFLQ